MTKTPGDFWTMQAIAAGAEIISADLDVSTAHQLGLSVALGKDHTAAFTSGFDIVLQGRRSTDADDDEHWHAEIPIGFVPTTASEEEALSGSEAAGDTVIEVVSTTNLTGGDFVLILDSGTAANSEFAEIASIVASTSVTLRSPLEGAKTSADFIYDAAVRFHAEIDVSTFETVRLVAKSIDAGQQYLSEAEYILTTF